MKGKWTLVCSAAILTGILAGAFSLWIRRPQRQTTRVSAPAPMNRSAPLTLTGKIRAAHVVVVNAEIAGNIEVFEANVGDEVYTGQELARIGGAGLNDERTDAAAAVEKAQGRVEAAEKGVANAQLEASRARENAQRIRSELGRVEKTFERQKVLMAAGATPRLNYEKAERDYEQVQVEADAVNNAERAANERVQDTMKELDNAKKILADRNEQLTAAQAVLEAGAVLAPVDGVIVGRNGDIGQPATQLTDGLFQIGTDLYDLEVVIAPPPDFQQQIQSKQPALVIIPDLQGLSFTGEVKETKGEGVVVSFKSSNPAIRPGMVAQVRIQTQ